MKQRTRAEIEEEHGHLWDKVWWNRHMARHAHDHDGSPGCNKAIQLEKKYGREWLARECDPDNPVEWGIVLGQFMALGWVLGAGWGEAGDT
jgi:hypothetical protein